MELINQKEFFKAAIGKNIEAFLMYITSLNLSFILIYLTKKDQIDLLIIKEMNILKKCSNFFNIFLKPNTLILLEITNLNQYVIELQQS